MSLTSQAELCAWRQVSKTTNKSFNAFVFGAGGFRKRVMDFVRSEFTQFVTQEIEKFQNATGAMITGSVVLKILANEPWDVKDLDMIVPLNEASINAFETLIRAIGKPIDRDEDDDEEYDYGDEDFQEFTGNAHITKFDSLKFRSFQPKDDAAKFIELSKFTEEQEEQEKKDQANFQLMRQKFRNIKDMCENFGYNKHVRAVYFAIDELIGAPKKKMDVVFVPEEDLKNVGGLVNWMKYNFDFQICANAVLPKTVYSLAPLEIANRAAFLRLDQYCCDVKRVPKQVVEVKPNKYGYSYKSRAETMLEEGLELVTDVRWKDQFEEYYGMCNCEEIAPNRVRKYEKRGYHVETGTCTQYKEWRKINSL